MIKLNLLPSYILERRKVSLLLKLFAFVIVAELGGLFFMAHTLGRQINEEKALLDEAQAEQELVKKTEAEIETVKGETAPEAAWVKFFGEAQVFNAKYATVLEQIARYIYSKSVLQSMSINGSSVSISGTIVGTKPFAQFYLNILRCPVWASDDAGEPSVTITNQLSGWDYSRGGVTPGAGGAPPGAPGGPMPGAPPGPIAGPAPPGAPGMPGAAPQAGPQKDEIQFSLACVLSDKYVVTPPGPPGAPAAPGAGAPGGPPGMPPGGAVPPGGPGPPAPPGGEGAPP